MSFNFKSYSKSPSTPNRKGKSSLFSAAPSTTPAGPPPSHLTGYSTTPAGNPPRSSRIFGSSVNTAPNTFGRKGFAVPESSPPREDDGSGDEEDAEGESVDEDIWAPQKSDIMSQSPRGSKRSLNGQVRNQDGSGMVEIARSMAKEAGPARRIEEPDDVILGTEDVLTGLDIAVHQQGSSIESKEEAIVACTAKLARLWDEHSEMKTLPGAIGPEADDGLTKATYLSTLLLQLHSPYTTKPVQPQRNKSLTLNSQRPHSSSISLPRALLEWLNTHHNPLPDDFESIHLHRPSPSANDAFWDVLGGELLRGRFSRVIRLLKDAGWQHADTAIDDNGEDARGYTGRQLESVEEVVARCTRVLESCPAVTDDDWNVAGTDWDLFRQRVRHALRDLEAYATADSGTVVQPKQERNIFKESMAEATSRAESLVPPSILRQLKVIYGILLGGNGILDFAQDWLEGAIFFTVWWDGEDSSDGLDASLAGLNVSHMGRKSLKRSTRGGAGTREVDVAPLSAYRRRLTEMFGVVTNALDEANFQPDTLDPVHVGLGCVLEDSVEGVVGLLRAWSPTIAEAVVELAALGGWLPSADGRPSDQALLQKGFSSEDLMVLSHGPGGQQDGQQNDDRSNRDAILTDYAELLSDKDAFLSSDDRVEREGWELAVSVLGRLDDSEAAQDRIRAIVERIRISDAARVEKVLDVCQGMGWVELGRGIAERYADSLADQTPPPYGSALIYYARAHATEKLKEALSILISVSLVQSAAMPPQQTLDPQLASLLSKERSALVTLARIDTEAAALLGKHLSGYATLRRFYELRDQDLNHASSAVPRTGLLERKRQAAKALVTVIESASDCIRGGLFDPDVQSVVPVEGLLVLLGEMLPLLGQPKRILENKHVIGLMAVIEDLEAVSARIRENATGLLSATMNAYRSTEGSGKSIKKSKSDLSSASGSGVLSGSSWEQLAESSFVMLQSTESAKSGHSAGSGKKGKAIEMQRGWDWRKGLDAVSSSGVDVGSKELILLLRTALAQEVAKAWSGGYQVTHGPV